MEKYATILIDLKIHISRCKKEPDSSQQGQAQEFVNWTLVIGQGDFFYGLGMTQGYQLDHSPLLILPKPLFDNVLPGHVGQPYVLNLAVHLDFCSEQLERVNLSHFNS